MLGEEESAQSDAAPPPPAPLPRPAEPGSQGEGLPDFLDTDLYRETEKSTASRAEVPVFGDPLRRIPGKTSPEEAARQGQKRPAGADLEDLAGYSPTEYAASEVPEGNSAPSASAPFPGQEAPAGEEFATTDESQEPPSVPMEIDSLLDVSTLANGLSLIHI